MQRFWSSLLQREDYSLVKKKGSLQKNDLFDARFYKKKNLLTESPDFKKKRYFSFRLTPKDTKKVYLHPQRETIEDVYHLSCSIILSRKFGSSPQRNRGRRRVRAALENLFLPKIVIQKSLPPHALTEDIILLIWPKSALLKSSWDDLVSLIQGLFHSILEETDKE